MIGCKVFVKMVNQGYFIIQPGMPGMNKYETGELDMHLAAAVALYSLVRLVRESGGEATPQRDIAQEHVHHSVLAYQSDAELLSTLAAWAEYHPPGMPYFPKNTPSGRKIHTSGQPLGVIKNIIPKQGTWAGSIPRIKSKWYRCTVRMPLFLFSYSYPIIIP